MMLLKYWVWSTILLTLFAGDLEDYRDQATDSVDTADTRDELVNVDYNELQRVLDSYRGEKAVLFNIWATWCGPCVEELPYIKKLQEKYPDKLQVVLLSADLNSDRSRVVPFLKERGIDWTTYYKDGDDQNFLNKLSDQWSGALPFTKILNREGELIAQWQGSAEYDTFHQQVKKAIEE
jgi:thiol-disulfide isomerase/thioredoxin